MTLAEVIDTLQTWIRNADDEYDREEMGRVAGLKEALHEIKKIEPCEDAISRQAVIDAIDKWVKNMHILIALPTNEVTPLFESVHKLPHVTPQPKTGHWIPVSERLPEDQEVILVSTKTDRVFEGRYYDDNTKRQWYSFRDDTFAWNNVVTAWMPLPEPYQAESEVQDADSN